MCSQGKQRALIIIIISTSLSFPSKREGGAGHGGSPRERIQEIPAQLGQPLGAAPCLPGFLKPNFRVHPRNVEAEQPRAAIPCERGLQPAARCPELPSCHLPAELPREEPGQWEKAIPEGKNQLFRAFRTAEFMFAKSIPR